MYDAKQPNWWQLINLAGGRWAEVDGDQRAAAFAYCLLLSLLPLAFMLVSVEQIIPLGVSHVSPR